MRIDTNKLALLRALVDIQRNGPSVADLGICGNAAAAAAARGYLRGRGEAIFYPLIADLAATWSGYSGDSQYPVRHPTRSAEDGYSQRDGLWEGVYGDSRRELLDFLVRELQRTCPGVANV